MRRPAIAGRRLRWGRRAFRTVPVTLRDPRIIFSANRLGSRRC